MTDVGADEMTPNRPDLEIAADLASEEIDRLTDDIVAALKERECVCVLETAPGRYRILGDISPEMRDTYEFAVQRGRITARDFIEQKDPRLSIAASSNRLARMRDLGLLVSIESETVASGGRQNIYAPIS